MAEPDTFVAEQFDDFPQQELAATLGMWTFLSTEVLFFGGLFLAYAVYRISYPAAFAEASRHTVVLLGTVNTAILLTSSLTMALAVRAARLGRTASLSGLLLLTALLGGVFLAIKGYEYHVDIKEHLVPGSAFRKDLTAPAEIFWFLYWVMTGLHALHVSIGVGMLLFLGWFSWRGRFSSRYHTPVEVGGLYWHFVDLVWIWLYPLLYLADRSS